MIFFCPRDGTILDLERGENGKLRFYCVNCPYIRPITKPIVFTTFPKQKAVDEVMGGADAWKNVDSTAATCPKCRHDRAYFQMLQTRSADEPMTTFYKCCSMTCGHNWKED
ncbi:hypothetical protein ACOMHN_034441 [Nucella lapillus]